MNLSTKRLGSKSVTMLLILMLTLTVCFCNLLGLEVQAAGVGDVNITNVATGKHHTLALDSSGRVWSWGQNYFGQLGLGYRASAENADDVLTPHLVSGVSDVVAIAASYNSHSLALTKDGEVYAWGNNYYGQLGLENTHSTVPVTTPTRISTNYFNGKVTTIAAGYNFSMAITDKGTLYTWGINTYGELGIGNVVSKGIPQEISLSEKVTAISAGWESAMILTASGKVYVCGYGGYGEMGDGTYTVYNRTFKQVPNIYKSDDPVVQISNDGYHMLALTENGTLWSWGKGDRGELGNAARLNENIPQNITSLVPLNSSETIVQIDAGYEDMAVLTDTGRLLACGTRMYGALGDGGQFVYTGEETTLRQIFSAPEITRNIVNGGAGYYKRFVISNEGGLYVTGNNWYGTLGTMSIPHELYGITTVYTEIAFGGSENIDYFDVTYDANTGIGGKVVSNIALNENHMVLSDSEAEVSKDGWTFIGWNTSADGSGDLYTYGSSINVTSNMTLYAQWEEVIYWSVIYLPGEGTGGHADEYLSSPFYTIKTGNEADVSNGDKTVEYWRDMYTNHDYYPGEETYLQNNLNLWPIWSD